MNFSYIILNKSRYEHTHCLAIKILDIAKVGIIIFFYS